MSIKMVNESTLGDFGAYTPNIPRKDSHEGGGKRRENENQGGRGNMLGLKEDESQEDEGKGGRGNK